MMMEEIESGQINRKTNTDKSLIGYVVNDLGGVLFAVESIDKTLEFASKAFRNNRFYQGSIKVLRGLNPVILTGNKIYNSIKGFREQKKHQYARQKKNNIILKIMGLEHLDEYDLEYYDFNIGKEIISWFTSRPNTESFQIVDFFNSEFESISSKSLDKGEIYIMIESDKNKYMIEADIDVFNNQILVSSCHVHAVSTFAKINEFKTKIFSEFIKRFDTKNNVIEMTVNGLKTRPRMGFNYDICQFNVKGLRDEIKNAVHKKKKRGYILVGPPGVGKSTVIIKLEKELPDIPIIYISSTSGGTFREDVVNTFNFLRSICPCIAIFEDLDSYELSHKQDRIFGEFIDQMDSMKHKECIIVIATLNEPENVHSSLINRRGRFDKVFFVDYPKTHLEILQVMQNKFNLETNNEFPLDKIDDKIVKKIVDNMFTHSDICEIIDSLIINDITINSETIEESADTIIRTMESVSKCVVGDIDNCEENKPTLGVQRAI